MTAPAGQPLGIEAVASETLKAIKLGVTPGSGALTLQLAPTGALAGRVTTPGAPSVTNLEGVDVFVPGTAYTAKSAQDGSYAFEGLPVGVFELVASKTGLGRGSLAGLTVASMATTRAPELALAVNTPAIAALSPARGLVGTTTTVTGEHFGASTGATFSVTVGGVIATAPRRIDDRTLELTIPDGIPAGPNAVIVTVDGIAGPAATFTARKLAAAPTVEIVAGGLAGHADGPGRLARFRAPTGLAVAPDGTIFVADSSNHCLRKVVTAADGSVVVSTVAGTPGTPAFQEGAGTAAAFYFPNGLALDAQGMLYVADVQNGVVRGVDTTRADYPITTVAGRYEGERPESGTGPTTTDTIYRPFGLALDRQGRLLVSDSVVDVVRRIDLTTPGRPITTIAGTPNAGSGRADGQGPAVTFRGVAGLAVAADGAVFVADSGNCAIRKLVAGQDGVFTSTTVAGTYALGHANGAAAQASFTFPAALALAPTGTLYVGDSTLVKGQVWDPVGGTLRQLSPAGVVAALAGGVAGDPTEGRANDVHLGSLLGLTFDHDGNLLFTQVDKFVAYLCRLKLYD